jgi:hypothetical protein
MFGPSQLVYDTTCRRNYHGILASHQPWCACITNVWLHLDFHVLPAEWGGKPTPWQAPSSFPQAVRKLSLASRFALLCVLQNSSHPVDSGMARKDRIVQPCVVPRSDSIFRLCPSREIPVLVCRAGMSMTRSLWNPKNVQHQVMVDPRVISSAWRTRRIVLQDHQCPNSSDGELKAPRP